MQKRKIKKWLKKSNVISINSGYISDGYMLIKINGFMKKCFEEVYPNASNENVLIRDGKIQNNMGLNLKQMIEDIEKNGKIDKVDFTNLTFIFKDKYEVLIYKYGNEKIFINRKFLDTFGLDYDNWHGVSQQYSDLKMKIVKLDKNNKIEIFILGIRMTDDSLIYRDII